MRNLLVCAAVDEELEALGGDRAEGIAGWRVRTAAVGVGPVEAALGTAALMREPFDAAILVGTCGAFAGSGLAIGSVALVERAWLGSSDAATGLSYIPAPAAAPAIADAGLADAVRRVTELPAVGCATVAAITKDAEAGIALSRATGAAIEHMEAFGFLRAAARAGVPAACLLGVANDVGPEGHQQWTRHAASASAAAIEILLTFLRAAR